MAHEAARRLEPDPQLMSKELLVLCIAQCFACALACSSCAEDCLADERVQDLALCIRLNLDSADVCNDTGRGLVRQMSSEPARARSMLEACAQACRRCAEECEFHARDHEHCRVCAEACRRCEQACNDLASTFD
jgi:hypothetical protein